MAHSADEIIITEWRPPCFVEHMQEVAVGHLQVKMELNLENMKSVEAGVTKTGTTLLYWSTTVFIIKHKQLLQKLIKPNVHVQTSFWFPVQTIKIGFP